MTLDRLSIYPNQWVESTGVRPFDPIGPPRLIPDCSTQRAGQFIVDLSDAAPQPREGESIDRSTISNKYTHSHKKYITDSCGYITVVGVRV